jgi:hypothetical protein
MGWAKKNVPGYKAVSNTVIDPISKPLEKAATAVLQPVEKAVIQPINRGLVGLDKMVGNAIPGGWGTVGMTAASFIPGAQFAALGLGKTAAMTGLGALTGSGVLRPGRGFNVQGAIIGGAAAYGASKLADYAAAAGGADKVAPTVDTYGNLAKSGGSSLVTEPPLGLMDSITKSAGDFGRNLTSSSNLISEPTIYDRLASSFTTGGGGVSDSAFSNLIDPGYADVARSAAMPPPPTLGDRILDFGKAYAQNVSDVGSGIKNLITEPGLAKATAAATGINPMQAAGATMFGVTGMMALDEQEKYLNEQLANQQIAQADYDRAVGEINRQRDYASRIVQENPFRLDPVNTSTDRTLYDRTNADNNLYDRMLNSGSTLYAEGGEVQGYFGGGILGKISPALAEMVSKSANRAEEIGSTPTLYEKQFDKSKVAAPLTVGISSGGNLLGGISQAIKNETPYLGETLYARENTSRENNPMSLGLGNLAAGFGKFRLFAEGGQIDDELGGDYSAMGMDQGNLQKGLFGMGYAAGGMPNLALSRLSQPAFNEGAVGGISQFAAGGQPRFLSGGGDGMSDSIKARINGTQEARLADGEFVIPADVVSHLGNGSSKAGAKQLYSMMDKIRKARTGNPKQGKQINPRKYLPA